MLFLRRIAGVANVARLQSTQASSQPPRAASAAKPTDSTRPQVSPPMPAPAINAGPPLKGKIAMRIPKLVELEPNKKYYWCACGLSKKQPFCDGTHKTMPEPKIPPVAFEVPTAKKVFLCRCKQTHNRPFCDLTHIKTFIPEALREKLGIKL